MIAASILVLAAVLYFRLGKLTAVVAYFGHVVEKGLNQAAERRGDPPVTTPEDAKDFM